MMRYVTYELDDGSTLMVEQVDSPAGVARAGLGQTVEGAVQTFDRALSSIRQSAIQLRKNLEDLRADEVEVKFGLKATGEAGNYLFAIGKVGVEANYEVTLKWSNQVAPRSARKNRRLRA